jgi:hypothetical protein
VELQRTVLGRRVARSVRRATAGGGIGSVLVFVRASTDRVPDRAAVRGGIALGHWDRHEFARIHSAVFGFARSREVVQATWRERHLPTGERTAVHVGFSAPDAGEDGRALTGDVALPVTYYRHPGLAHGTGTAAREAAEVELLVEEQEALGRTPAQAAEDRWGWPGAVLSVDGVVADWPSADLAGLLGRAADAAAAGRRVLIACASRGWALGVGPDGWTSRHGDRALALVRSGLWPDDWTLSDEGWSSMQRRRTPDAAFDLASVPSGLRWVEDEAGLLLLGDQPGRPMEPVLRLARRDARVVGGVDAGLLGAAERLARTARVPAGAVLPDAGDDDAGARAERAAEEVDRLLGGVYRLEPAVRRAVRDGLLEILGRG